MRAIKIKDQFREGYTIEVPSWFTPVSVERSVNDISGTWGPVEVNWSCCGKVSLDDAEEYAKAILLAVKRGRKMEMEAK